MVLKVHLEAYKSAKDACTKIVPRLSLDSTSVLAPAILDLPRRKSGKKSKSLKMYKAA